MTTLNYMVTSNHIHLLVADLGERDVIPKSMKLVAGRTGQEYNQKALFEVENKYIDLENTLF